MLWHTARGVLDLGTTGVIMGIVNVTPDSFSDGGRYFDADRAIGHALKMLEDGAAIVDIGGESTRPGADPVSVTEEMQRVLPVIKGVLERAPESWVSIDTSKAEVARAALEAGAAIVNDVTALRGDAEMAVVTARARAGLVLMHMQGSPRTMQQAPFYNDVVSEVRQTLLTSLQQAEAAGVGAEFIALDPGIGFGKNVEHNLALLRHLPDLVSDGRPLVIGLSRKSFLSKITTGDAAADRLWPTVALTAMLRDRGARVFRVHDVRENLAALKAVEAVLGRT